MASYNIVSVRRTPNQSAAPTYTELGPLAATDFSVIDTRDIQPGGASFSVNMDAIDATTKTALRDLAADPLEVWVYRDGTRIFKGPIVGGGIQENTVTLECRGPLLYLAYMLVETNKSFTATDLFTIGKTFVNDWQAQDYGNFGVDTSSIGTLGTTRDVEVPGATEFPTVLEALASVASGSFDVWVNPVDSKLNFAAVRGTDLSASVVIERGIAESSAGFALGPGLLASEVFAAGTSANEAPLTTTITDATLRAAFGRVGFGVNHDPVVDAAHLTDLATVDQSLRAQVFFRPGGNLFEVQEATYADLAPGNLVEYSYDAGLGRQTLTPRIEKRQLSVGPDGTDKISVEFE